MSSKEKLKTPRDVIQSLYDTQLIDAVSACEDFRNEGVMPNDSMVRRMADEINHLPVDAGTRNDMIVTAVYREAAVRWLQQQVRSDS